MNKESILVILLILFVTGIFSSCSKPTGKPLDQKDQTDVSAQADIPEEPDSMIDETEEDKIDLSSQAVSTSNKDKIVEQFAMLKKIIFEITQTVKEEGNTKFLFAIDDQCYLDGSLIEGTGGYMSPIPLLDTWRYEDVQGIDSVRTWGAHGTMIRIEGRRKTETGNWYDVELVTQTINPISGWIPEALLLAQSDKGAPGYSGSASSESSSSGSTSSGAN